MFGNFFNKSSFGLDIGDDSIKFVELIDTKKGIRSGRYGEQPIPEGVITDGKICDLKRMGEILLSLKKEKGIRSARVSLLCEDLEDIKNYVSVFKFSGIKIKSLEHQMHSISRSIVERGDFGTYMVVNQGKETSDIFIISGGIPVNHRRAPGAIYLLRDEIAKLFLGWHTQKNTGELRFPIKKIILCGSGDNLAEFSEHLSLHMRHPAEVANVWINILDTSEHIPEISIGESFGYAPALGAALGGMKR